VVMRVAKVFGRETGTEVAETGQQNREA